jgi:hypothetical protein
MSLALIVAVAALAGVIVLAGGVYIFLRYYEARHDRTFMTHDERGFKRALQGKTVLWDWEESVVKGPTAPQLEFVAFDPATGGRRTMKLLDPRTGAINLRPHYCAPLPFEAVTADKHKVVIDARVQFSLNRELLRHAYEIQELSLALETRIQSAFRSEIGKRKDEELRAQLQEVEAGAIAQLRQAEDEGDEKGERGMALGVRFHTANFTFIQPDEFASPALAAVAALPPGATPEQHALARAAARSQGVLTLRPQQLDQLADVFKDRDATGSAAILALLEMQTRQNIAEALAASGQLVVMTPQELGLLGPVMGRDGAARTRSLGDAAPAPAPVHANGGLRVDPRP